MKLVHDKFILSYEQCSCLRCMSQVSILLLCNSYYLLDTTSSHPNNSLWRIVFTVFIVIGCVQILLRATVTACMLVSTEFDILYNITQVAYVAPAGLLHDTTSHVQRKRDIQREIPLLRVQRLAGKEVWRKCRNFQRLELEMLPLSLTVFSPTLGCEMKTFPWYPCPTREKPGLEKAACCLQS